MKRILSLLFVTVTIFTLFCNSVFFSAAEQQKKLKIGDLVTDLPNVTFDECINVTDDKNIENGEFSISWKEFPDAAGYSVKNFFNINFMGENAALRYLYESEFKTDTNSVTITGLQKERRYTVLVYAIDSEGNEIAVYDKLFAFTYSKLDTVEEQDDFVFDVSNSNILIIVSAVIGVLVLIAIMVLIIVVKKTK